MDFSRRLKHFLTIYDTGSLGQASEQIHITQPALSKSLHQLEDEVGVPLFERTPSGVVPTVYGKALSGHVRVIEAEFRTAEAEIASLKGATKGHVYLGVGPSMVPHLMPKVAIRVVQERPGITMTIVEGLSSDHLPALRRGDLDLAVGTWPAANDKGLVTEKLMTDRITVVARKGHRLCGKPLQLSELLDCPWILPPHSQSWRNHLDEIFLEQGLSFPEPSITTNSPTLLRSVLQSSDYLSFLPSLCIQDDLESGALEPLEVEGVNEDIEVVLTYRKRSVVSPVAHAIVEVLREMAVKD